MMFAKLLALVEKPGDITLAEIQEKLAQRDTPVGIFTVWRFFARHRITHKRDCARYRAGPP